MKDFENMATPAEYTVQLFVSCKEITTRQIIQLTSLLKSLINIYFIRKLKIVNNVIVHDIQ